MVSDPLKKQVQASHSAEWRGGEQREMVQRECFEQPGTENLVFTHALGGTSLRKDKSCFVHDYFEDNSPAESIPQQESLASVTMALD